MCHPEKILKSYTKNGAFPLILSEFYSTKYSTVCTPKNRTLNAFSDNNSQKLLQPNSFLRFMYKEI